MSVMSLATRIQVLNDLMLFVEVHVVSGPWRDRTIGIATQWLTELREEQALAEAEGQKVR